MDIKDFPGIKELNLPKVGQLGFVVNNIEKALPHYSSFLNINTWYEPKYTEKQFQYDNEKIDLDVNLVIGYSGHLQIELVEAGDHGNHMYGQYIERHGEGLHHLGFYVSNLDEKLRVLDSLGIRVSLMGMFKTAGGGLAKFAYLDTDKICGITFEVIEVKLFRMSIPQTQFFMNIAKLTGDVSKIRV
jgi:catechol 2,3-dioxygenase-like lactoylglutathione lyase family enzyme